MASIFDKSFFKNLFGKTDLSLNDAVDLNETDNGVKKTTPLKAPKGMPQSLYNIDDLLKKQRTGRKDSYDDNPILDKYYKRLSKQERRLDKGKMIEFESPLSERYYRDGDIGQRATKENKLPNAETSGYTGLYTKPQLHQAGLGVDSADVETADIPSTAIAKVRYNPKTNNMYITYTSSDKEYLFPNVPSDVARKFLNAESKGRFANKRIKKYAVTEEEAKALASRYRGK